MEADAAIWLAIGSALYFAGALAVAALCRMALRQRAKFEVEIKAPLFSLKFKIAPPKTGRSALDNQRGEVDR